MKYKIIDGSAAPETYLLFAMNRVFYDVVLILINS